MYSPLQELNLLMDFQETMGFGSYAPGFGLTEFGDFSTLETRWSVQPTFLDRLVPFAQADDEGAFYALWRVDDFTVLARMPVIVFGASGGTHVMAADIRALLRLLALSPRLRVDEDQAFYVCDTPSVIGPEAVAEDRSAVEDILLDGTGMAGLPARPAAARQAVATPPAVAMPDPAVLLRPRRHSDFVDWLDEVLGLAPATDCSIPVAEARTIFAEPYRSWATPYLTSAPEYLTSVPEP
jgi:hypothetical protein